MKIILAYDEDSNVDCFGPYENWATANSQMTKLKKSGLYSVFHITEPIPSVSAKILEHIATYKDELDEAEIHRLTAIVHS